MSEKISIEEWIHKYIDLSWEPCNSCAWVLDCEIGDLKKCPFRDYKLIEEES